MPIEAMVWNGVVACSAIMCSHTEKFPIPPCANHARVQRVGYLNILQSDMISATGNDGGYGFSVAVKVESLNDPILLIMVGPIWAVENYD
jgi:hypothetical protein